MLKSNWMAPYGKHQIWEMNCATYSYLKASIGSSLAAFEAG